MDVGFPRIRFYNSCPWRWNDPPLALSACMPIRLPESLASVKDGIVALILC